jgi:hypothetical protein
LHREDPAGLVVIAQPTHTWVSGQLARAWGSARFGQVAPWEEICLGAEQRDAQARVECARLVAAHAQRGEGQATERVSPRAQRRVYAADQHGGTPRRSFATLRMTGVASSDGM